jgi:DNA repair exonuclease SbcCD ATPase subunit
MKNKSAWLLATLAAVLAVGCASQKEPAEKAVSDIDASLTSLRDEAQKYAPDQLQSVDSQVTALKDSLAKSDYKGVLAAAPAVTTAVGGLKETVEAKKAEAAAATAKAKDQWSSLSTDVPKMVDAIQSRVDVLSKSKHLPKNLDKATLESAKSGLETLKSQWGEASSAATAGDFTSAAAKAQAAKDKATEIMSSLGMTHA